MVIFHCYVSSPEGICGSLETPEPIWIWNLVSQIRQLIIIVRLKWQCWAIPQFQKHPQYHSFVVPPNSVAAVGCQEDKVKGTAGPLFTTFHDHLTSCGPNDFDECRKIYPIGSMVLLYMVTFTYIYHQYTPMLAYIPAPWIRHGY